MPQQSCLQITLQNHNTVAIFTIAVPTWLLKKWNFWQWNLPNGSSFPKVQKTLQEVREARGRLEVDNQVKDHCWGNHWTTDHGWRVIGWRINGWKITGWRFNGWTFNGRRCGPGVGLAPCPLAQGLKPNIVTILIRAGVWTIKSERREEHSIRTESVWSAVQGWHSWFSAMNH